MVVMSVLLLVRQASQPRTDLACVLLREKDCGAKRALTLIDLPLLKTHKKKQEHNLQSNLLPIVQLLGLSQVSPWLPCQVHD